MFPPRKRFPEENVDSWLMSYADMVTLLMSFFIIFVSVSEPRKERLSQLATGMGGKFGTVDLSTPFNGVMHALQGVIEANQSFHDMAVESDEKSVFVELSSKLFFKPSSAELAEDKLPLLIDTINTLKTLDFIDYNLIIEGHTSDANPEGGLYATNWDLSSARASRIVRMFIEQGIKAKDIQAVGMADTQPKVPNLDMNNKPIRENRDKNERVVIKLQRI
jgi:chemotaxis protein MotB